MPLANSFTASLRCVGVPCLITACTTRLASCWRATSASFPWRRSDSFVACFSIWSGSLSRSLSWFQISLASATTSACRRRDCLSCFKARFCADDDRLLFSASPEDDEDFVGGPFDVLAFLFFEKDGDDDEDGPEELSPLNDLRFFFSTAMVGLGSMSVPSLFVALVALVALLALLAFLALFGFFLVFDQERLVRSWKGHVRKNPIDLIWF